MYKGYSYLEIAVYVGGPLAMIAAYYALCFVSDCLHNWQKARDRRRS